MAAAPRATPGAPAAVVAPGAPAAVVAPGAPAAGNPRGSALATIKATLKSATSPLKAVASVWSNSRINKFVDDADRTIPPLAAGAVFDINTFATDILADMNTLARQNAKRGNASALAALIPITRDQIGI